MGLDMWAFSVDPLYAKGNFKVDFGRDDEDRTNRIFTWRKHHDLHGWMYQLAVKKGFNSRTRDFNCVPLRLELIDLLALEEAVRENKLPVTTGFFFGNFPPNEDSMKRDLEFIELARKEIDEGFAVYYNSWW